MQKQNLIAAILLGCSCREGRAGKLEAGLRRIGVEKLSREDLEAMEWKELEKRIEGWRKQVKLAVSGDNPEGILMEEQVMLVVGAGHSYGRVTHCAPSVLALCCFTLMGERRLGEMVIKDLESHGGCKRFSRACFCPSAFLCASCPCLSVL